VAWIGHRFVKPKDQAMLKRKLLSIALCLTLVTASSPRSQAQSGTYTIDHRHSVVGFTVKIAGGLSEVDGSFGQYQGSVEYDPADITTMKANIEISVASVQTGQKGRDGHLQEEDFFYASQYPSITFTSTGVKKKGKDFIMTGPLTMRGVTKQISIIFRRTHKEPVVTINNIPSVFFEGETKLNRLDYGIKSTANWSRIVEATGEMAMSDEIAIHLKIVAEKR
jgi:polyisoprenoid-binding protein YceI